MNLIIRVLFHRAWLVVLALPLLVGSVRAQTPGVDCIPEQGQGWQGCAPVGPPQQQQPVARWESRWGAFATDGPGGHLGIAANASNKTEAEKAALNDCHTRGGSTCNVELAFYNQCAAFVVGIKGHNSNSDATIEKATAAGIKTCNEAGDSNCHALYTTCSLPVRVQ